MKQNCINYSNNNFIKIMKNNLKIKISIMIYKMNKVLKIEISNTKCLIDLL